MNKQHNALEDSLFDLAMLGMMELEGCELLQEEKYLKKLPENKPLSENKLKLEKRLRHYELVQTIQATAKHLRPIFSRVAVIAMAVILGTSSVLVVSADAREMFYKLLVHETSQYTEIGSNSHFDGVQYAPIYIPKGYKVTNVEKVDGGYTALIENGSTGKHIVLLCGSRNGSLRIDTENADSVESITIGNSEALLVVKGERILVSWQNQDTVFAVQTNDNIEEAIKVAQSIE